MFKEKTSKKRLHIHDNNKDISTLDAMHNKIIKDYSDKLILKNNYNNDINDIISKKNLINEEILNLYKLDNRLLDNHYDTLWSCNIKLQEDLLKINQNIKDLDNFNEIEYYEKTSDILFNYYDMLEKQSKIDNKINFTNDHNS